MKGLGKFFLLGIGATLVFGAVNAADGDKYWSLLGSAVEGDDDRGSDDGSGLEGTYGWELSENWNFEIALGVDDIDGDTSAMDLDQTYAGVNLLNVYRRDAGFQPYILFGSGFVDSDPDSGDSDTNFYANIGFGALIPINEDKIRIRTEYVSRWENDSDTYRDDFINIGVAVPFGRKAPVPAAVVVVDTDGDGVPDAVDQCPNSPPGTEVDEVGCERDDDNDGVLNSKDECPNTWPDTAVDEWGCAFQNVIKLPEVNFRTDSAELLDGADAELAAAAATLIQNPNIYVEVAGHTDSQGDPDYNIGLSQRRAETVRSYLVNAGVDENRVTARGYGETEPVADNGTAEGRAENRRVELRVIRE